MKAGFWQIIIVTGLVLFFFWPLVVRIVRFLAQNRGEGERPRLRRSGASHFKCPKCGREVPNDAKFCSHCGTSVDYIDV